MRDGRMLPPVLACILLGLAAGCASTTAPRDWLPTPSEAQSSAFGAWISVRYTEGRTRLSADGELIAAGADSVFLLTESGLTAIPSANITHATLTTYDANWGTLALWTTLGSLSTLSHGVGLILSAPVWIVTGTIATAGASYAPQETHPPKKWQELRKFARFPQGLPAGLDKQSLKPK